VRARVYVMHEYAFRWKELGQQTVLDRTWKHRATRGSDRESRTKKSNKESDLGGKGQHSACTCEDSSPTTIASNRKASLPRDSRVLGPTWL
jgi:hypothetical protein